MKLFDFNSKALETNAEDEIETGSNDKFTLWIVIGLQAIWIYVLFVKIF